MHLIFARYGGLSPVKYKNSKIFNEKYPSYHIPPRKKGIYAFIYPYIESFFWAWNHTKYENVKNKKEFIRKFEYNGLIWCHFGHRFNDHLKSGSWVQVTTNELKMALKAIRIEDQKMTARINKDMKKPYLIIKNPYNNSQCGGCSTDHLEVFIEARYLGKIK